MQKQTIVYNIKPEELANLISDTLKKDLHKFTSLSGVQKLQENEKPHLTRKETADFFNVSLNCINDWCKKGILEPIKVGQRTYFLKSHLLEVLIQKEES